MDKIDKIKRDSPTLLANHQILGDYIRNVNISSHHYLTLQREYARMRIHICYQTF